MFRQRIDRVGIRYQLALMTVFLIFLTAVTLGALNYETLRRQLLRGIDRKLLTAAYLAEQVPPEGYFDRIVDAGSVTSEAYEQIVERNNRLCRRLGLQYLWSCMIIDDRIVFTTSTSPGKDVTQGGHAYFFEVHGDPHAFDTVFATMKPDYSSFHNEWGHGRMVLVPALDGHGRPYCFGASMSLNDVAEQLRKNRRRSVLIIVGILAVGMVLSFVISNSLTAPLETLTNVARNISRGNLEQRVDIGGSLELRSLSRSIDLMSESIRRTIGSLEDEIKEHRRTEQQLAHHRDHLEEMVDERTRALKEAQERLLVSERLAILGQFAGSIAHEIRNPLGVISASIYYLKRCIPDDREKVRSSIGTIEDQVDRCVEIIDSTLNLTRLRSPRLDRRDLVEMVRSRATAVPTSGNIEIEWRLPEGPVPVLADRAQLQMAFDNLINNALQAMETGGTLTVEVTTVPATKEAWAEVRFSDTGSGIDPRDLDQIFEPLFTTKTHGVGFGLAIVKLIVERHGGRITVESTVGVGTTFVIGLPRSPVDTGD